MFKSEIFVIKFELQCFSNKSRNLCYQQICQAANKQQIHHGTPAYLVVAKRVPIESP